MIEVRRAGELPTALHVEVYRMIGKPQIKAGEKMRTLSNPPPTAREVQLSIATTRGRESKHIWSKGEMSGASCGGVRGPLFFVHRSTEVRRRIMFA